MSDLEFGPLETTDVVQQWVVEESKWYLMAGMRSCEHLVD